MREVGPEPMGGHDVLAGPGLVAPQQRDPGTRGEQDRTGVVIGHLLPGDESPRQPLFHVLLGCADVAGRESQKRQLGVSDDTRVRRAVHGRGVRSLDESRLRLLGLAGEEQPDPEQHGRRRSPGARRSQLRHRARAVLAHLVDAMAAEETGQHGRPGVERAAVRHRTVVGGVLDGLGPALGRLGPTPQRVQKRAEHRDHGIAFEQGGLVELQEPALGRGDAAAAVERESIGGDETGHDIHVTCGRCIVDRGLGELVGGTPRGCATIQLDGQTRLGAIELRPQQVLEQVVIPVPPPVMVERDDEHVRALERLEHPRRVAPLQHRVAEGSRHALEDGGSGEEPELLPAESREMLRPQVVGDETIVTRESGELREPDWLRLNSETRQVEAGCPALGAVVEQPGLLLRNVDPAPRDERVRLRVVESQVGVPQLEQNPPGPKLREREMHVTPAREHEQRAWGHAMRELHDHVDAVSVLDLVDVVENEHERNRRRRERRPEPRDIHLPDRRVGQGEGCENLRVDVVQPIERRRDVRHQHDGVVVSPVERDPGERATPVLCGPLGEKRRLAVAGRSADAYDCRVLRTEQPLDEPVPAHERAPRRGNRELRLVDERRQCRPPTTSGPVRCA